MGRSKALKGFQVPVAGFATGVSDLPWAKAWLRTRADLGLNAVILPGVTIGAFSQVAAGSVVTKSVEPRTVVAGVPAAKMRSWP